MNSLVKPCPSLTSDDLVIGPLGDAEFVSDPLESNNTRDVTGANCFDFRFGQFSGRSTVQASVNMVLLHVSQVKVGKIQTPKVSVAAGVENEIVTGRVAGRYFPKQTGSGKNSTVVTHSGSSSVSQRVQTVIGDGRGGFAQDHGHAASGSRHVGQFSRYPLERGR